MVSLSDLKHVSDLFPNAQVAYISPSTTGSLHYLNIRVTERLHRYRLLKRQWNDLQLTNSTSDSRSSIPEQKEHVIPPTRILAKNSIKLEPLRSQIQHDLLQLRKIVRIKQKKSRDISHRRPLIANQQTTIINIPENNGNDYLRTIVHRKSSVFNRMQLFDPRTRSSIFPQNNLTDSGIITINNSSNSCVFSLNRTQKIKQEIHSQAFNICGYRVNPSPPSDYSTPNKTSLNIHLKSSQNINSKQPAQTLRMKEKKNKSETFSRLSCLSSDSDEALTSNYAYATSTSSSTPQSMKLNRNVSLLPILLGTQSVDPASIRKFSNHPTKPIIPLHSQDADHGYAMLSSQLDRLRITMPNTDVYNDYTRIC
ncbi:unnamed protein product [Adineta ricciae]|uniref:Uncharacterized protein n=1 Tax=Adineta ricciae TaxID=249248 RepID=A0A816A990_ADIRI|nr:unnamed protein product [Adineta ricciae]CAF1595057.1 unnamed protein product [Adineta ricciae]